MPMEDNSSVTGLQLACDECFGHLLLGFWICFVLRVSDFEFCQAKSHLRSSDAPRDRVAGEYALQGWAKLIWSFSPMA